jgi:hypothetical protein
MRGNQSDAAAHTPSGGVFSWKKEDFDQKRWYSCEKEGRGVVDSCSYEPLVALTVSVPANRMILSLFNASVILPVLVHQRS